MLRTSSQIRARIPVSVHVLESHSLCRRVAIRPKLYSNRKMRRPVGYPEHPASVGQHLLRKRRISGLRQREVAAKLRVGLGTYFTWELGTRSPSIRHWPALIAYLGYDPVPTLAGEAGQIEAVRRQLGWSLRQVADFIGVDQGTLARWKNERTTPVYSGDRLDAFLGLETPHATNLAPAPFSTAGLTLAEQLRMRRTVLGLSQRSAARRLGVTGTGFRYWELDRQRPEAKYWPGIVDFLAYNPLPLPETMGERIEHHRLLIGWTYKETAKFVGVDKHTVLRWVRRPDVPLLRKADMMRFLQLQIAARPG